MRIVLLLISLLLCCNGALAAEQTPSDQKKAEPAEQTETVKPKTKTSKETGSRSPRWPRPYQPREEVSADSVVPFPTDI